MSKTPFLPGSHTLAANPFNRVRWNVNEIEGKFDCAVRALMTISEAKDLNVARKLATEALTTMARETQKI